MKKFLLALLLFATLFTQAQSIDKLTPYLGPNDSSWTIVAIQGQGGSWSTRRVLGRDLSKNALDSIISALNGKLDAISSVPVSSTAADSAMVPNRTTGQFEVRKLPAALVIDGSLADESPNAIANNAVYDKFTQQQSEIDGKAPSTHDHDSRYLQITNNLSDLGNAATARSNLGAAATSHTHSISNVSGLQSALDDKVDKVAGKQLSTEDYKKKRIYLASNVVNNNAVANTLQNVTGLSFPVTAGNRYEFTFYVDYTTAATGTGSRWTIDGPPASYVRYTQQYNLSATTFFWASRDGYNQGSTASSGSSSDNNFALIHGTVAPTSSGTIQLRFASEDASIAVTALAGSSYVEYEQTN